MHCRHVRSLLPRDDGHGDDGARRELRAEWDFHSRHIINA